MSDAEMTFATEKTIAIFEHRGGYLTHDHFVFTGGMHSGAYINKDAIYPHTGDVSLLCLLLAAAFKEDGVEAVVGPAIGGVVLTQWVAYHLSQFTNREVLAVYGEKDDKEIAEIFIAPEDMEEIPIRFEGEIIHVPRHSRIIVRRPGFVIKRGYEKLIAGKHCLAVEDILSTGTSAKGVIQAVRELGGDVVGLGALWNRGMVTAADVGGVEKMVSLVNQAIETWEPDDCPLCMAGEPVNIEVGHGKDFVAEQA